MAANFPGNPTIGDTVTIGNNKYKRGGTAWNIVSSGIVAPVAQSNNGTIDLSKGNYHKILIDSGNNSVTVSFTNVPSGSSKWFLELNVSDSYTITWPDSVIWDADTAPATTGSQTLILEFYTPDGGTTIYGIESINRDETLAYVIQGSVSGYTSGGSSPGVENTIDKFPFASDANATDVGNLTQSRGGAGGTSSSESGYTAGGGTAGPTSYSPYSNTIDKFPFASNANATDVGNLTVSRGGVRGITGTTHGYSSGGKGSPANPSNVIDKFPFASDGSATDVGDISSGTFGDAGNGSSSETFGYHAGLSPTFNDYLNRVEKFPFASDANSTNVGQLIQSRNGATGQSSDVSGYTSGGFTQPGANERNTVDKYPFASDANAADVGDLTEARNTSAGQSSTTYGYTSGSRNHPADPGNIIDKFPFASDTNATDVGDLTRLTRRSAGQQV